MQKATILKRIYQGVKTFLVLVLMILAGSLWVSSASGKSEFTLKMCVKQALLNNNALRSYDLERRAVAMEVKQALASFYPSLSFGTSFNRADTDNAPRSDSTDFNLKASYTLFRGGGDWSELKARRHAYQASGYDFQEESLKVVALVQATYFAILSLKNRIAVLEKSVEAAALHETVASKRVKAGLAPLSDRLRARVDLSNARVDLIQEERNAKTLKHTLSVLMGQSPLNPLEVEKRQVMNKVENRPLEVLFNVAKKNRPVLKSYQQQILELKWKEKSVKAEFFPTLETYAAAGQNGSYYLPEDDYWQVGITLSYPIFSGFSTRYAAATTRARLEAKQWSYREKILQVQKEIADAYEQLKADEKVISAREALLNSALENGKVAQHRYKAGVGSIVELTDARVAATNAAIGLENAKLTVRGDEIELKRVTGWFVPMIKTIRGKKNVAKTEP
jgi:outer membrane protein TolC